MFRQFPAGARGGHSGTGTGYVAKTKTGKSSVAVISDCHQVEIKKWEKASVTVCVQNGGAKVATSSRKNRLDCLRMTESEVVSNR